MTAPNYIRVDYVDHGVQSEYGWFGKVVARSDVRGMSPDEISSEISEVLNLFGSHIVAVKVEEIPALDPEQVWLSEQELRHNTQ